jgi:hypothetical protein
MRGDKHVKPQENAYRWMTFEEIKSDDVRWSQHTGVILRTAKDNKDYSGGRNNTVHYGWNFEKDLLAVMEEYDA